MPSKKKSPRRKTSRTTKSPDTEDSLVRLGVPLCTTNQVTVLIDAPNREKKALRFPRSISVTWQGRRKIYSVRTRRVLLGTADYRLDVENSALAERKGSLTELRQNLFSADRRRFLAELERLAAWPGPTCLFLDIPAGQINRRTRWLRNPTEVFDELIVVAQQYGLQVLWVPPSARVLQSGSLLLRWLLMSTLASQSSGPTRT